MKMNKTILLIDDDPDDRALFLEALREADPDIECLTAKNGLQAIEILSSDSIDMPLLIFLDLRMPRLGGKKILAILQNDPRFKAIPVVIYTTSRSVDESAELISLGACHFVSKPTNPEDIYYLVSLMLEEHVQN
jgi:CheY-like chemotaxis protein